MRLTETRRPKLLATAAVLLALAVPNVAQAAGMALTCAKADVMNAKWGTPVTFHYDGDAKAGTLSVTGPFGDFSIPATRVPMPIGDAKGEAIDAVAKARVKLPPLDGLQACIAKLAGPGKVENDDLLNARDGCLRKLEAAPGGVDAVAQIRLGFTGEPDDSGEDAFVVFKLRYDVPGQASDAGTSVEAFPAQCTLQK